VIQCPTTTEEWTAIAEQFEKRWQFPHCCGALDGKHFGVTCPWNTGSVYRNYKGFFSIVLMALVLHYTPGSGESVVKYSLMVLHVSDGKRVHQALVDPKSIVPYYVVWDRNVITR
jgi:hypothetical protein